MQAPHSPVPQPYLVPVSLRPSRITHNKGVAGGASVDAALPFTVKFVAICFLPTREEPRPSRAYEPISGIIAAAGGRRKPSPGKHRRRAGCPKSRYRTDRTKHKVRRHLRRLLVAFPWQA